MPDLVGPPSPPGERPAGWSWKKWLVLVAFIFAAQVVIIFVLGEKRFPLPRTLRNVPQLTLADSSSELIALDDPTLFALPHKNDFAFAVWNETPAVPRPSFRWTEPPGELLSPARDNLGAVFARFMQTNPFAAPALDFKPEPTLNEPALSLQPVFAGNSSLQIAGTLAQRKLLTPLNLTNWPYAGVIAPSKVQVLVDASGKVISAVLLPAENAAVFLPLGNAGSVRYGAADRRALELARSARFFPSTRLTVGQMIFYWHTIAPPATNSPPVALP